MILLNLFLFAYFSLRSNDIKTKKSSSVSCKHMANGWLEDEENSIWTGLDVGYVNRFKVVAELILKPYEKHDG